MSVKSNLKSIFHSIVIIVLSVPLVTHYLKLELGKPFSIGNYSFTDADSVLIMLAITIVIWLNIMAITSDYWNRISCIASSLFLLMVAGIQLYRLVYNVDMIVLGELWSQPSTATEIVVLLLFAIACLWFTFFEREQYTFNLTQWIRQLYTRVQNSSEYLAVLYGMMASVVVSIPIILITFLLAYYVLAGILPFSKSEIAQIYWIGLVGAQGSIASMLLRMRQLTTNTSGDIKSSEVIFINSFFKPFIGLTFANFSYFVIEANLFSDDKNVEHSFHFHLAIAFIVGFTERISKDFNSVNASPDVIAKKENK